MQPVTEQILAWPYQHRPQRAEGEVEQKQLLGDTANDGPHWWSLTRGLRCSLTVEHQQQHPPLCNFKDNSEIFLLCKAGVKSIDVNFLILADYNSEDRLHGQCSNPQRGCKSPTEEHETLRFLIRTKSATIIHQNSKKPALDRSVSVKYMWLKYLMKMCLQLQPLHYTPTRLWVSRVRLFYIIFLP